MKLFPEVHIHVHGPVHVHLASDADVAEIKQGLRTIDEKVDALQSGLGVVVTKIEDVRGKVAAVQGRLDNIAADGQRLRDLILAGQKGLNETEADEALALIDGILNRATVIDDENPEPATEPPVEPA